MTQDTFEGLDGFDEDRQIQPHQLDVECVRQADRFFHWCEKLIEQKHRVEMLELGYDALEARLQLKCRESPADFGLQNATEKAVSAAVMATKEILSAREKVLQEKRRLQLLERAVSAMEMKKRMLESLITLHGQEYFAGPSTPHDLVSVWEDYVRRRSDAVGERQRIAGRKRVRKDDDE